MATNSSNARVLVTGASGFLGIHCVQQLLREGYTVRGTVRDVKNQVKIEPLRELEGGDKVELVEADLEDDKGWTDAVKGCTYVLHVASPFPIVADESIIKTAVDGTLRVLRAAAQELSVKKVVLTSSCAAINEGHDDPERIFNEDDWTNVNSKLVPNYSKSKTLAEKAAWDFVRDTPAVPYVEIGMVDVRDVVFAHIKSLRESRSDGERILVTAQPSISFMEIANVLRKEFGPQGYYLPRFQVPYAVLWLYSFFDREARELLVRVGHQVHFDTTKAETLLGMKFMDPKQSLIEMAYDVIERGMAPKRRGYHGRPPSSTDAH
ncbi:Dihydroflavonol-4-reductase [Toxocara canis]|uniref:Dihydroflavonol-4-reductase n=1 Tax=Toxocara canis TaxID=6265 RepID=A0A0B2UUZ6_TOXCA|nr:Dihydroflavonol-4-reductase [Toxocara canis]